MNDQSALEAKKRKKNEEKEALKIALLYLNGLVIANSGLMPNSHGIIKDALSVAPSDANYNTIKIVLQLQNDGDAGKLRNYVNELDANKEIATVGADTIDAVLVVAPTIPFNATAQLSVAPHQQPPFSASTVSHKLGCSGIFSLSPKARENLAIAGTVGGISLGIGIFLGTGIAGFVLSAKAAAVTTAVVACAATAGAAFPPLAIGLLAAAGVAFLVSGVILLALHLAFKNSPMVQQTGAAMLSNSH